MSDLFDRLRGAVRLDALREYLLKRAVPCFESELLKVAFPDFEILRATPLELWRHHFALFHCLYELQAELRARRLYLHVHFMRTSLAPLPAPGQCRQFDAELGRFCASATANGAVTCAFHAGLFGENQLDELSDRYFYADPANLQALDETTAAAFLQGTWEVFACHDRMRQAFRALDLAPTSDRRVIRRRFADLARTCHPDTGASSHERFCEINRAYRLLLRLLQNLPADQVVGDPAGESGDGGVGPSSGN